LVSLCNSLHEILQFLDKMLNSLLFTGNLYTIQSLVFEIVFYVSLLCFNRLTSPLSKDETRRDSSLAFTTVIKTVFMYFCV